MGAGQLALMMAEEAVALPLDLSLLAHSVDDPAVSIIPNFRCGAALDFDAVVAFGRQC
ncbi:MAG: 5-(carboxyamino)imidazole ribonucleotide synthase, partial [Rhodobacteraceae bacterium]|nr:5-(carboxyamino)imidazole ribonucleotide synthase [Paracoccaceae bacterium]